MFRHSVWGIELLSDIPLPSLRPSGAAPSPAAREVLRLAHSLAPLGDPPLWLYNELLGDDATPWRGVGLSDRGYFVRLHGAVDFLLENKAPGEDATARFFVDPAASIGVVEPLFLEQALPLWLSLLGRPTLHASAIAWGEGDRAVAMAFAGRSGSGKSTLATTLAASTAGDGLLADDCLVLEMQADRVLVQPGHRAVRLLGDSAHALFADAEAGERSLDGPKRRIDVRAAETALPLARFYELSPGADRVRITTLRPRDALARLATHLFRVDPEDYGRLPAELDLLDRLAARVCVKRLELPRRFDALDEVRDAIAADLESDEIAAR